MSALSRDGWVVTVASGIRTIAYGYLAVSLGIVLAQKGLSAQATGFLLTAALVGGALITLVVAVYGDAFGRRRLLRLGALLMCLTGLVYAFTSDSVLLFVFAVVGALSTSGRDLGPYLVLDQAILAGASRYEDRTKIFSWYNLIGFLAAAVGALLAGLPALLGLASSRGSQVMLLVYAGIGLAAFGLYLLVSPRVEVAVRHGRRRVLGLHRSQRAVFKMCGLSALDAFASGLTVQTVIALWLYLRFDTQLAALGVIFFSMNLLSAVSQLLAPRVTRRIGLFNTMLWTHVIANLPWLLIPFMPSASWVIGLLIGRSLLNSLDVPARQSYLMALVSFDERSATAGLTSIARVAGAAVAMALVGAILVKPALGLPFLIAGCTRLVYEVGLYGMFRNAPLETADLVETTVS